jgi:hypothetical protein
VHPIYLITLITLIVQGCHLGSRMSLHCSPLHSAQSVPDRRADLAYSLFPLLLGPLGTRIRSFRLVPDAGRVPPSSDSDCCRICGRKVALYVPAVPIGIGFVVSRCRICRRRDRPSSARSQHPGYAGGHMIGPLIAGYAIDYYSHFAHRASPRSLCRWDCWPDRRLGCRPRRAPAKAPSVAAQRAAAPRHHHQRQS